VYGHISTSRLNPSQGFHLKPINLVISEDILSMQAWKTALS